jgi:hypothetical protein
MIGGLKRVHAETGAANPAGAAGRQRSRQAVQDRFQLLMNFAAIIDMHKYLVFSTLRLFAHYKYGMSTRAKSGYQTFSRTEIFSISFWLSREGEEFFDASGGGGHGVRYGGVRECRGWRVATARLENIERDLNADCYNPATRALAGF